MRTLTISAKGRSLILLFALSLSVIFVSCEKEGVSANPPGGGGTNPPNPGNTAPQAYVGADQTINYGKKATFTYWTVNATSVTIVPGEGPQALSGNYTTPELTTTTQYIVTAHKGSLSGSDTITINVTPLDAKTILFAMKGTWYLDSFYAQQLTPTVGALQSHRAEGCTRASRWTFFHYGQFSYADVCNGITPGGNWSWENNQTKLVIGSEPWDLIELTEDVLVMERIVPILPPPGNGRLRRVYRH